jgi:hypothetical protein
MLRSVLRVGAAIASGTLSAHSTLTDPDGKDLRGRDLCFQCSVHLNQSLYVIHS